MARADAPGLGWEISTFGVLRCLTEFSAGTALCALWLRWAERPLAPAIGSAVVAAALRGGWAAGVLPEVFRSEEHTSELQSLMRISYAAFCIKKKINIRIHENNRTEEVLKYYQHKSRNTNKHTDRQTTHIKKIN